MSHWLRLKQIALVAEELAPVEAELTDVLGIEVCFRDPGIIYFGLENALMPIGNQLLEVVAPVQEETAGGRYLDRRGGDGGYMVIIQCDDHAPRHARAEELGIRIVHFTDQNGFKNMQLHPQDTGGSFFEIDEQYNQGGYEIDGPWEPAGGAGWQTHRRTGRVTGIAAAEVQCDNPAAVAGRWSDIAQIELREGELEMPLENATVRFVACEDGRPEGLGGIDIACNDPQAILEAAERLGKRSGDKQIQLCGMRINLV